MAQHGSLESTSRTPPIRPFQETFRRDVTSDPRQADYPEDSQQWIWLLSQFYDRFGVVSSSVLLTLGRRN